MSTGAASRIASAVVWVAGLFFVLYGLAFTLAPYDMAAWVTGDAPGTPSAAIDMRATYGGMSVAVGLTILLLGLRAATVSLALLITAIVLLAMAATRLLGIALDGSPNGLMLLYLVLEVVGAAVALFLRRAGV